MDGISFIVEEGSVFGFIGPNGAGKTTTLSMIATLLEPDAGEITVGGFNTIDYPQAVRSLIGYMPDHVGMYDGVRIWEYLDFFAAAYRIDGPARKRVIEDTLELTDLAGVRDKLISTLSKGMRQRLVLAKTLLHDPKVLLLDEPAAGLDPRARIELRVLLKELQKMGKTIVISSHILTELSDMCDSVGIVEGGRMVTSGSVDSILARRDPMQRLKIRVLDDAERAANTLRSIERVSEVERDNGYVTFSYSGAESGIPALLKGLLEQDVNIVSVEHASRNLEDVFMSVTRGEIR